MFFFSSVTGRFTFFMAATDSFGARITYRVLILYSVHFFDFPNDLSANSKMVTKIYWYVDLKSL